MNVFTSRYQNHEVINELDLVPISITLGNPRFKLGYKLAGRIAALAPKKEWFALDDEGFDLTYRRYLDGLGLPAIQHSIALLAGDRDAVLLCFESVPHQGELSCHRRTLAHWWEEQTGEPMLELEDRAPWNKPKGGGDVGAGMEERARKVKVDKLLGQLRLEGIGYDVARATTPGWWNKLAERAGCNKPSPKSRDAVLDALRGA